MSAFKDLTGQRFGDWLVESYCGKNARNHAVFNCKCLSCGKVHQVVGASLISGASTKCRACATKKSHTKPYSNDPIKVVFKGMKQRCYNLNNSHYNNYGGRGIGICIEWLTSPESFYAWAYQNGYSKGMSIERIDINQNYSPENCKFIPFSEQSKNRSMSIMVTIDGVTKCLSDWSKDFGINVNTVKTRHNQYGMSWIDALKTPVNKRYSMR